MRIADGDVPVIRRAITAAGRRDGAAHYRRVLDQNCDKIRSCRP